MEPMPTATSEPRMAAPEAVAGLHRRIEAIQAELHRLLRGRASRRCARSNGVRKSSTASFPSLKPPASG